ncbi:MAG: Rrf2 family transcriptional regulator [Calditrichia bacterium]|nr:Rrf2 family transcriptional regulator [Calditrichia bacterium]
MLRISKKMEYALMGLLHMSHKDWRELTTAKELAQSYNIPPELMGKVLQNLAKHNLIESMQGVKGGYRLVRSIDQVKLSDVITAVEGPLKIVNCLKIKTTPECHQHHRCTIKNPMGIIQNKLENFFSELTLQDIENDMTSNLRLMQH